MPSDYASVGLFIIVGTAIVLFTFLMARLIRPARPNPTKQANYECGESPIGPSWIQYHVRYYTFALIFVIFDVEALFLIPWAVSYKSLGLFALIEMLVFLAILIFALIYAWAKGALKWV